MTFMMRCIDLDTIKEPKDVADGVGRDSTDDGDVLALLHGQVHGRGGQLGGTGKLGQAQGRDPDTGQPLGSVTNGFHLTGHVALGQPKTKAS